MSYANYLHKGALGFRYYAWLLQEVDKERLVQAYLGDIVGSAPDHLNKVNIAIK